MAVERSWREDAWLESKAYRIWGWRMTKFWRWKGGWLYSSGDVLNTTAHTFKTVIVQMIRFMLQIMHHKLEKIIRKNHVAIHKLRIPAQESMVRGNFVNLEDTMKVLDP